jgi:molybdenum cofactor guanylyltransferase
MLNANNFASDCTLGLLAGGQARRLNGANKALLSYQDELLFVRILKQLDFSFAEKLISTQQAHDEFAKYDLRSIFDNPQHTAFSGPLAGIEALMLSCKTDWLLTLPVDIKRLPLQLINACLVSLDIPGTSAADQNGIQPLCTLWHVPSCKQAVSVALNESRLSVRAVIEELGLAQLTIAKFSFGNLNTAEDFGT